MKILKLKKIILFDGDQDDLFALDYLIKCPSCSKDIQFEPSSCQSVSGLSDEILSEFLPKLKGLKMREMGDSIFYKVDDLPLR